MAERSFSDYVAAANATLTDAARNRQIGTGEARFDLYHAGPSISSQQVRMALAEKGAAWVSHDMVIHPPGMENYHPDVVRLRMQGGAGRELVSGYTGRTATRTEGFDPTAVPTLVDRAEQRVHVDAVEICEHLDRRGEGGAELVPARLRRDIDREVAIADGLPLQALIFGAHPDGDFRAPEVQRDMAGAHDYKIMKLMEARSLSVGHPRLIAAYDAKIRKEAAARHYVRTPELMRGAAAEVLGAIADLDGRLADGREWAAGDAFTLADVFWAAALWRLKWLGMGFAWEGGHALNATEHARVGAYAARLFARPTFRAAVIDWPTMSRTAFVADFYRKPAPQAHAAPAPRTQAVEGHGRDIREESLTAAVLATMKGTHNPRARTVLNAFTRHLHAFLEEVRPSEEEWEWGIEFLTKTGHLCKGGRQEFILLSDVMGATARVDMINNRVSSGATENSVLGPFYVEPRPSFENGADISGGIRGKPMFFNARVMDTEGNPIPGANVDIWHADGDGGYDVIMDGVDVAMRGLFRSDAQGRVWFLSILPESYPIPDDGTVGQLLHVARRNIMRPAHVHVRIEAPGYRRLTTMLFLEGDPYLDADPVFGVKQSLVMPFVEKTGVRAPDGRAVPSPAFCVDYDFVLTRDRGR
jgi:hydroxyquinol 1,2-dioxygenase